MFKVTIGYRKLKSLPAISRIADKKIYLKGIRQL